MAPTRRTADLKDASRALRLKGSGYSIKKAANVCRVGRISLHRSLTGVPTRDKADEAQQLLSPAQESALVEWIKEMQGLKHPCTPGLIRYMAGEICDRVPNPPPVRRFPHLP